MLSATAPRRTRPGARGPKSRNGCISCKARGVKCDETKPECQRCKDFFGYNSGRRSCNGYLIKPKARRLRDLPPIAPAPTPAPPRQTCSRPIEDPRRPLSTIQFTNSREAQYFQYFFQNVAVNLSAGFDSTLWDHVILHACYAEPCLRDAVVAVAALSRTMQGQNARLGQSHDPVTAQEDHMYAARHYGYALRGISVAVSIGAKSIRVALLGAVLISCFESLYGGHESMVTHAQSAINLVSAWQLGREQHTPQSYLSSTEAYRSSLAENALDEVLVDNLTLLDLNTSWIDPDYSKRPNVVERLSLFNMREIPSSFENVNDAHMSFVEINQRCSYHINIKNSNLDSDLDPARVFTQRSITTENIMKRLGHEEALRNDTPTDATLPDNSNIYTLFSKLEQWSRAFAPLLRDAKPITNDYIPIYGMQAAFHSVCLLLTQRQPDLGPPSTSLIEAVLLHFKAIIDLCTAMIYHPRFGGTFTFDIGVVPHLFLVAVKCPKISWCEKAVELLRGIIPRRESVWDSVPALIIAEFIVRARKNTDIGMKGMLEMEARQLRVQYPHEWRVTAWDVSNVNVNIP